MNINAYQYNLESPSCSLKEIVLEYSSQYELIAMVNETDDKKNVFYYYHLIINKIMMRQKSYERDREYNVNTTINIILKNDNK